MIAGHLDSIFTAIRACLPEGLLVRIGGGDEIAKHDSPPRLVLEPVGEEFDAAHGQGYPRERFLCTRVSNVDVHIWAETLDGCEELVDTMLNVLQALGPSSNGHRRRGGRWIVDSSSGRGLVYVLGVSFLIPVLRQEGPFAQLGPLPIDGEFMEPTT